MSVKLDPTSGSVNPNEMPSASKPKPSLLQRWGDSMYDGHLKETLPPQKYCERLWIQQTGSSPTQATEVFMKACIQECVVFKEFCRGSRLL